MNKNRFDNFTLDEKITLLAGLGSCYTEGSLFAEIKNALGIKGHFTGWDKFNSGDEYRKVIESIKKVVLNNNEKYQMYLKLKKEFES